MRLLILGCGALLVLALAVILLWGGPYPDVLFELRSQPRPHQIAWIFIVIVSLIVLASAIWLNETTASYPDA